MTLRLKQLKRGYVVRMVGEQQTVTVFAALHYEGGGAGMGEYPESWTVVLSDGRVLTGNGWSPDARRFEGLRSVEPDSAGRLVP